ncbi:MAG: HU family DNA-binding protein [Cyclobacteriaceae bacterium]|nr:HU family DNA-binding protein [Cyclobacteriaceae bacterium]
MPIKFKVIERGQPGVPGGGAKKFYASANVTGEKTLNLLTKDIEKMSTVNGADIRAVLYALVDVMKDALAEGQVVRLGELGSLRVSISSEGKEKAEEVKASVIEGAKVIFTPGKDLKTMLETLSYQKM